MLRRTYFYFQTLTDSDLSRVLRPTQPYYVGVLIFHITKARGHGP